VSNHATHVATNFYGATSQLPGACSVDIYASSAKTVGGNQCLIAAKRRESLESCPQQAASRMGL
jgi:hypothetical protein